MKIFVEIAKFFLNIIFFFLKLLPVRDKVVMISRQADEPSEDFTLLKGHINKKNPDVEVVMLCHTLKGKLKVGKSELLRYGFHILRQMLHIATAKVVVLDSYCIVISLLAQRKELEVIQMWHAMGNMKKFGYTALDTQEGTSSQYARMLRMHKNYTTVLISSDAYVNDFAAGFGCDESILKVMALPRTDLLRDEDYARKKKREILEAYPQFEGRKVILYCPTFRQDESEFKRAAEDLAGQVESETEVLVANLHPLSEVVLKGSGVIFDREFSSFDMLFAADAVITDYSCMAYEAAFRGIPVYFYNFDMEIYRKNRGISLNYYNEIPGPAKKDAKELMDAVRSGEYDFKKLRAFSEKYITYTGHAGADIADYVLSFCGRGKTARG